MAEFVNPGSRVKALDVLRAVAILLVFGRHRFLFAAYHNGGWSGVDLFFVLSGFLISGLLFTDYKKSGGIRIGRFLIRRGFKIYPPVYVFMGWTVLMYALHQGHLKMRPLLSELFFLQSYIQGMWVATWSLAVEEHFYLLLPLLLLLLCRYSRHREDPFRMLPGIFLAVAAGSLALRFYMCSSGPQPLEKVYYPSHMCADVLFFGVVLSYVHHFRPTVFARLKEIPGKILLPVSLCLIAPCFFFDLESSWFIQTIGHPMLFLGYGGLLLFALSAPALPPGFWAISQFGKALAFIGKHSYSIYLWHAAMTSWGMELLRWQGLLPAGRLPQFAIFATGSLVLGILMSRLVEIPALKLRERLFPSLAGALAEKRSEPAARLPIHSPVTEAG